MFPPAPFSTQPNSKKVLPLLFSKQNSLPSLLNYFSLPILLLSLSTSILPAVQAQTQSIAAPVLVSGSPYLLVPTNGTGELPEIECNNKDYRMLGPAEDSTLHETWHDLFHLSSGSYSNSEFECLRLMPLDFDSTTSGSFLALGPGANPGKYYSAYRAL